MQRRENEKSDFIPFCMVTLAFGIFFIGFLIIQSQKAFLSAMSNFSSFHVFVSELHWTEEGLQKRRVSEPVFGYGSSLILEKATEEIASLVHPCRRFKRIETGDSFVKDTDVDFEVKLFPKEARFAVVGILRGAETNPTLAACLRDKVNKARISSFTSLPQIPDSFYFLRLSLRSSIAASWVAGD